MRKMWYGLGVVGWLVACLLPALTFARATGHGGQHRSTSHSPGQSSASASTLRLAMPDASITVDPALVTDEGDEDSVVLANLLYSGLVRLDASYQVVPGAATWTVAPDHQTYTFHLRPGLRFSNGDPVTAQDFAFSITRSLSPALKSTSAPIYLLDIKGASAVLAGKAKTVSGIKVINSKTLQLTARWPVHYFLMELTYPTSFALDAKKFKSGSISSSAWYTNPVSSGPYRLKSWTPNSQLTLVRNKYFSGASGAPHEIKISLTSLPAASTSSYIQHYTDVVDLGAADGSLSQMSGIRERDMLAINGVYMNLKDKPFDSVQVRRALTMALNRKQLIARTMGDSVTPFGGYVPPGEPGYDPQLKVLPHDVSAARKALAAAGFPNGKHFPSVTLYYAEDPSAPDIPKLAQAIVKAWHKDLNITVGTKALTVNTLLTKSQTDSLPLYLLGWSADYPAAHDWLSLQWKSDAVNNNVHYSNTKFDDLVAKGDVTWQVATRAAYYNQAQEILVNDAAWLPLYVPHRLVYVRPTVRNLSATGYGLIPKWGNWAMVRIAK